MKKVCLIILCAIVMPLIVSQHAPAQQGPSKGRDDDNEVKKYFMKKYQLKDHDVSCTDAPEEPGKCRRLNILGMIKVHDVNVPLNADSDEKVKAIGRKFILDEAHMLALTDANELKEIEIRHKKGFNGKYSHIIYKRYIDGIEMRHSYNMIIIFEEQIIKSAYFTIAHAPPSLYRAVKKKTLTEDDMRDIVYYDLSEAVDAPDTHPFAIESLKENGFLLYKLEMKKYAITSPPYVVWVVRGLWEYTIDAFTGEILSKMQLWQD